MDDWLYEGQEGRERPLEAVAVPPVGGWWPVIRAAGPTRGANPFFCGQVVDSGQRTCPFPVLDLGQGQMEIFLSGSLDRVKRESGNCV